MPYDWVDDEYADTTCIRIRDASAFVQLLTDNLSQGYRFLTAEQCAEGIPAGQTSQINNTLLGSISEFAVYVVDRNEFDIQHPFIGCFRAADPFGRGNFPLADIRIFHAAGSPATDRVRIQELKTTRDNPHYFRDTIADFAALYPKSRLCSTIEHLKFDLDQSGNGALIPRLNDCLGTCPEDSEKIELLPTGVSCDSCDENDCVVILQEIVDNLKDAGWHAAEAIYVSVPQIEITYRSFALGEGNHG